MSDITQVFQIAAICTLAIGISIAGKLAYKKHKMKQRPNEKELSRLA